MFEKILAGLGATLSRHNLPYMIIGGQAVLLYGEPRLTRDIDITLGVDSGHLDELLTIVQELSLKPLPEDIEFFVKQTMVLPVVDEESGMRVDFIFSFTSYEAHAIKRATRVSIRGQEVCFASVEDLVIHKIFAGRPRDIEDARSVVLKNRNMDIKYIRKWLAEFDAVSDEKTFLKTFEKLLAIFDE